jgi:non-ribosomal peptide synthetase component E (peptide arylation enzyme)
MGYLLHQTLFETAAATPHSVLLVHDKHGEVSAAGFAAEVHALAARLMALGIQANDRVAVFLPKLPLTR